MHVWLQAAGDMAVLLRLKRYAFKNFDVVARTEDSHWDSSAPMCQWQGVSCNPQGFVQVGAGFD